MIGMKHVAKHKRKTKDFSFAIKAVGDEGQFEGYGAVFDNVDYGGDVVLPGAFDNTIKSLEKTGRFLPMLWQHDSYTPIGIFDEIKEDEKGLWVKGKIFTEVQKGREALALMQGGAISGLSIGYGVVKSERDDKTGIRSLKELELFEISVVTFPMNDEARVDSVKERIAGGELPSEREFEKFLRDAGFSKQNATAISGHGIRGLLRDAEAKKANTAQMLNNFLANL
jgi:HK97 family phage prohead protease